MATISVQDLVAGESDRFVDFVVRLDSASTSPVTVQYFNENYTALNSSDYRSVSGTLNFAPGETSKTVRVELVDDTTAEGPEHFLLTLRSAVNATLARAQAAAYLVDDDTIVDTPQLFVRDVFVDEKAGTATFEVRLGLFRGEAAAATVSVQYATQDATATAGQDYVASSGTLSFAPGESVKTVVVNLIDDALGEQPERFGLVLSSPVNAAIADGQAVAEIGASDGTVAAQPRISVADQTVSEIDGYVDIVVKLHAPSTSRVTVEYFNENYTALNGSDYRYVSGVLSFAPGETSKTVRVELINDTGTAEPPEHFLFTLRDPTNATIARAQAAIRIVDNDTTVDTPDLFVRDVFVDEKAGTASFEVRLGAFQGQAANGTISVGYATQDATATAGQDYVARSGTLVFAPGESAKTVLVDLLDDTLAEGLERFGLVLSGAVNAGIGDGAALAEIGASDGTLAAQPRISVADVAVGEADGYADVVVSLHAPSTSLVTVEYFNENYTALNGSDYRYTNGVLTFAPGETTKAVRVELINDTGTAEPPEHFLFTLRSATNATLARAQAAIRVVDNDTIVDTPQLHVRDVIVDEKAGTASFEVRLGQFQAEAANGPISVAYTTQDATATAGQDYVARSGTLLFAPGESAKTVVVDLLDDTLAEPLERFGLVLSGAVNAAIGDGAAVAEIGLSDGTGAALPRIAVADRTVGEAEGYVDFVVSLHAPSTSLVSVEYFNENYSALNGSDYRYTSGVLTFAPGETTKAVRVELINDTGTAEPPEHFLFTLRGATNATIARAQARAEIVDNDTIVDVPELHVGDAVVDEKAGVAVFTVRLGDFQGQSANAPITVQFTTRDATAIAGQDYVARSGTLVFAPGESAKTVVVDIVDDALPEPLERLDFVLSGAVNALVADGHAVAEIAPSDNAPSAQPRIGVADAVVGESDGYVDFVVSLHARSASTIAVEYFNENASAVNGSDYRYTNGVLTFAPGETSKTVRVELINNLVAEALESFTLTLRGATNATIADNSATAQIQDDDDAGRTLLSFGRSSDIYELPADAVEFIEAAGGGLDIVRANVSYTLPAQVEGVYLGGSAASATGNALANVLRGTPGNNTLDGREGIDTAVFAAASAQHTQAGSTASRSVSTPLDGSDTLLSIERLRFADTLLAYDTAPGGNTYAAYAMLNAAFNAAPSPALLGQWTAQLDQLGNTLDMAQAMINFYAPGVPNDVLVAHLWGTIVGTPIGAAELATYVGLIDNGTYTQASLLELVATLSLNTVEFTGIVGQPLALDPAFFPLPG